MIEHIPNKVVEKTIRCPAVRNVIASFGNRPARLPGSARHCRIWYCHRPEYPSSILACDIDRKPLRVEEARCIGLALL